MQAFGPRHNDHRRVPWPPEMQSPSIQLPSSVLDLLSHNTLPSADQEFSTKNFQACLSEDILKNELEEKEVESQIRQLEKELKRIRNSRQHLDKQMLACDVALSPFRRLPDDILYNIAVQFCFGSGSKLGESPHRAMILGRISRAFRHTVRSTSTFWKEMQIQCWRDAPHEQTSLRTTTQIGFFSTLAASLPLSIHLQERLQQNERRYAFHDLEQMTTPVPHGSISVLEWMLDTSRPGSWSKLSQVEKLNITTHRNPILLRHLGDVLKQQQRTLTLESLLVTKPEADLDMMILGWGFIDGRDLAETLDWLPCLKKLWLGSAIHSISSLLFTSITPWARLTAIRLGSPITNQEWRSMLRVCPSIEAGWFTVSDDRNDGTTTDLSPVPHTHNRLKKLIIQYAMGRSTNHVAMFLALSFPSVTDLKLQFFTTDLTSPGRYWIVGRQLTGVFPALQSFTLLNMPAVQQKFKYIFPLLFGFSATTSLSITLSHADMPDFADFMRRVGRDGSMALPNLQTLEVRFMPKFKSWVISSEDRLTELLKSIAEIRNSAYTARIAAMEDNRALSAQQDGSFKFSICFNWDEADWRSRERAPNFNVMHVYFTKLRDNFERDGTPAQVYLRQEKISEASDDYLKDEFLQYF